MGEGRALSCKITRVALGLMLTAVLSVPPAYADDAEGERIAQIVRELEMLRAFVRESQSLAAVGTQRVEFEYGLLERGLEHLERQAREHLALRASMPRPHWDLASRARIETGEEGATR